jgi:hypothetical protein
MNTPVRKGIIVKGRTGDPESVYDTFTYLNTASQQQTLFQTFAGRTLDLTNMTDAGKLPTGKSLIVRSFNVYMYMTTIMTNAILLELYDFLARTTCEFVKENRAPCFTKTLQMLFGLTSLTLHLPTVAGDQVISPMPFFRGKMKIDTSALNLGSNQTFKVIQTTNVALTADLNGLQIRYELDGLMSKKITD